MMMNELFFRSQNRSHAVCAEVFLSHCACCVNTDPHDLTWVLIEFGVGFVVFDALHNVVDPKFVGTGVFAERNRFSLLKFTKVLWTNAVLDDVVDFILSAGDKGGYIIRVARKTNQNRILSIRGFVEGRIRVGAVNSPLLLTQALNQANIESVHHSVECKFLFFRILDSPPNRMRT